MLLRFFPVLRKIPTRAWLFTSMGLYFASLWLVCAGQIDHGTASQPIYGLVCLAIPLFGAVAGASNSFKGLGVSIIAALWLFNPLLFEFWVRTLLGRSWPPKSRIKHIASYFPLFSWVTPTFFLGILWLTLGYAPQLGALFWVVSIGFGAEAAWNSSREADEWESMSTVIKPE